MEQIKILYFIPCLGTGGTERVILNLCQYLHRNAFSSHVCALNTGDFASELGKMGIPVSLLAVNGKSAGKKSLWKKVMHYSGRIRMLHEIIATEKPAIIHTHHLGQLLYVYLVSRIFGITCKWIHTEHNVPDLKRGYDSICYKMTNPMLRPDIVTGVSGEVTSYLINRICVPREKARTVSNGIDVGKFLSLRDGHEKRLALGFAAEDTIIGAIGNLRKEKNHKTLLHAFACIRRKMPDARLVLCGDGECRPDLEKLADTLGIGERVHFLGYRLDAHEVMSIFDVYCLPSSYEGMPLSILEAWAAGKPVVATDVIGIHELVRHEETGLLVPSDDAEMLAEGVWRVLNDTDLRGAIARNGKQFVLENCKVETMVKEYEKLYQQVMGR